MISKPSLNSSKDENYANADEKTPWPVRAGLHAELQKFGKNPNNRVSIFTKIKEDVKRDAETYNIEILGINISASQEKALFAIQKLLEVTNYKGNEPHKKVQTSGKVISAIEVPVIRFAPTEYLDAYGVEKYRTSRRKMEYRSEERKRALRGLLDLHEKKFLLYYERKYYVKNNGKNEERYDIVQSVRSLITINEGYVSLKRSERDALKRGELSPQRLAYIIVEPCPILVDQIDSYFLLKSANFYQEIKLKFPHPSKYISRFIDYLIAQDRLRYKRRDRWEILISSEVLARILRMDPCISSRQNERVRGLLAKCFQAAKELQYLKEYTHERGKTKWVWKMVLNPEKYYEIEGNEKFSKEEIKNGLPKSVARST